MQNVTTLLMTVDIHNVEIRKVQLTNEEMDIIYDALEELRFADSNNESVPLIQEKIASLVWDTSFHQK